MNQCGQPLTGERINSLGGGTEGVWSAKLWLHTTEGPDAAGASVAKIEGGASGGSVFI